LQAEQSEVLSAHENIEEALDGAKQCALNEFLVQVKDDPRPEMLEIGPTEFGYEITYGRKTWMHFMVEVTQNAG
jgi:hypothetical protein